MPCMCVYVASCVAVEIGWTVAFFLEIAPRLLNYGKKILLHISIILHAMSFTV